MAQKKRKQQKDANIASGFRALIARAHRYRVAIGAGVAVLIVITGALFISAPGRDAIGLSSSEDETLKAIIVDQLDLTAPNPEFVADATSLMESDGYAVEYVGGADVTVDVYRELPQGDYDLVILRVHSTAEVSRGDDDVTSISLFTGQDYSEDLYYEEQLSGAVGFAQYTEDSPKLFGITAEFVRNSMNGRFDDTVVLMMGCQGFIHAEGAEAFADKGARTFVGWDGLVSAQHTDDAYRLLLRHLLTEGNDTRDAVDMTMAEIGPDPHYGSQLVARP